ncbi:MAG: 60S ribosomal protein L31 [Candidatus Marsarchaeota archaeon]|nr:60S ribosomal protein L31 [Candidatus Marsarchaeota archaeon]
MSEQQAQVEKPKEVAEESKEEQASPEASRPEAQPEKPIDEKKDEASTAKEEHKEEAKPKEAEELKFEVERDYVVPLQKVYWLGRSNRSKRAVNLLRKFVSKHMKSEDVHLDEAVNHYIWARSIEKPPRRISIHVGKTKENKVYVYLNTGRDNV